MSLERINFREHSSPYSIEREDSPEREDFELDCELVDLFNDGLEVTRPLTEWKFSRVQYYKNFIIAIIEAIFANCLSKTKLHSQEQLSYLHIDLYLQNFNERSDHRAVMMSSNAKKIEDIDSDYFEETFLNYIPRCDHVREALAEQNKSLLAFPINVSCGSGGRHWTALHLDFSTKTISYVDSMLANVDADNVKVCMLYALEWIKGVDGDDWVLSKEFANPAVKPSSLNEQKQFDFWNCGVFMLEFTALIGEGKTYAEIDAMPWQEMYARVEARRADMATVVDPQLEANAEALNAVEDF